MNLDLYYIKRNDKSRAAYVGAARLIVSLETECEITASIEETDTCIPNREYTFVPLPRTVYPDVPLLMEVAECVADAFHGARDLKLRRHLNKEYLTCRRSSLSAPEVTDAVESEAQQDVIAMLRSNRDLLTDLYDELARGKTISTEDVRERWLKLHAESRRRTPWKKKRESA